MEVARGRAGRAVCGGAPLHGAGYDRMTGPGKGCGSRISPTPLGEADESRFALKPLGGREGGSRRIPVWIQAKTTFSA